MFRIAQPALTTAEASGLQISKYFNVAGMAILIYDYAITLEEEVKWIWGRRWDATRVIFTISRYLPFLGMGMTAYSALRLDDQPCPLSTEENVVHSASIIAAEMLMILRTYAFYAGNRRLLYGLILYGFATMGASAATSLASNANLIPGGGPLPGCYFEASRNSTFMYSFLALFEILIMALIVYRRYQAYRANHTGIVRRIYRDGIFYLLCIISISLANVILLTAFPEQYSDLLDQPQITLHSVLASRIMFSLRKETQRIDGSTTRQLSTKNLSTIEYNTPSGSGGSSGTTGDDIVEMARLDEDDGGHTSSSGSRIA